MKPGTALSLFWIPWRTRLTPSRRLGWDEGGGRRGVARKTKSHQQDIEANITCQEEIGKGPELDGRQLGVGWADCQLSADSFTHSFINAETATQKASSSQINDTLIEHQRYGWH